MCRPILQYFLRGVLRDLVSLGQATLLLRKDPTWVVAGPMSFGGTLFDFRRGAADRSRRSEKERNTIMELLCQLDET